MFYLLGLLLVVAPLMIAELVIGGAEAATPLAASRPWLARLDGRRWVWIGLLAIATGFLLLSYYAVNRGLTVAYLMRAASGSFAEVDGAATGAIFDTNERPR